MWEMFKDGKHPIWYVVMIGLLLITLTLINTFNYSNGFDWTKDPRGQVVAAIVLAAGMWFKNRLTGTP
jgi:uncharacterized protein (DUF697 family)